MREIQKKNSRGLSLAQAKESPFELFLTQTEIRFTYYKDTYKVLGNTFGMCVLQVLFQLPEVDLRIGLRSTHAQLTREDNRDGGGWRPHRRADEVGDLTQAVLFDDDGRTFSISHR